MAYLARLTLNALPGIRTHDRPHRSKIHTSRMTAPPTCDTSDHQLRLTVLVSVIVSLAERALFLPLWWPLTLRVLRCGCEKIGCWRLGEEHWNRDRLRGKRITLGARRILGAILILILGLMLMGKLVKIAKGQF